MEQMHLDGGFSDPVFQSQHAFRTLMNALANPGTIQPFDLSLSPPAPLPPALAAVALTLCDHETQLWLDRDFANDAVVGWLRFHAGLHITSDPKQAHFALVQSGRDLQLDHFSQGTDIYPDRSTTIVVAVDALSGGPALTLAGPGINGLASIAPVGLPDDFLAQWQQNQAQFPRGVDLVLVAGAGLLGLPRTSRISRKDA